MTASMLGVPTEADALAIDSLYQTANDALAVAVSNLDLLVGADDDWRPITLEDVGSLGTLIDLISCQIDASQAMLGALGAQFRWLRTARGSQQARAKAA